MTKIDNKMQQIYTDCTKGGGENGGQISQKEALLLIQRAEEINSTASCSTYKAGSSSKGNKYLMSLMTENRDHFSPQGRQAINQYIETGHIPANVSQGGVHSDPFAHPHAPARPEGDVRPGRPNFDDRPAFPGHDMGARPPRGGMPSHPDMDVRPSRPGLDDRPTRPARPDGDSGPARPGIGGHPSMPSRPDMDVRPGRGGMPSRPDVDGHPNRPGAPTRPDAGPARPDAPARPDPNAGVPGNSGVEGPRGREILNFSANKKTWHCHWFPMQERHPGGDKVNNLYAENGALDKLDKVNGRQAREYEYANNRKGLEAGRDFAWWGHCNNASEAACILREPRRNVTMRGINGEQIVFTPNDVQGLLVKVTPGLINKVDFRGNRFNVASRDNKNDPAPEVFLNVLQDWAKEGLPFVLDIDPEQQVWNYPYDRAQIFESSKAPAGFDASTIPAGGKTLFYHCEMSGTGFDQQKRTYEFYIQKGENGEVMSSNWIKTPNTDNNPDFMWRPHAVGDLTDKNNWRLRGQPSNPNVDPQLVYDIYMQSIV